MDHWRLNGLILLGSNLILLADGTKVCNIQNSLFFCPKEINSLLGDTILISLGEGEKKDFHRKSSKKMARTLLVSLKVM